VSVLALDFETTTYSNGSPYDQRNYAVCVAYKTNEKEGVVFGDLVPTLHGLLKGADTIVAFNAKFELAWLRKLGLDLSGKRVWCSQVFEFLHSRQERRYPSLDDTASRYDFGRKIDIIETEYWSKGINTHEIPADILAEYALQDVKLTWNIYHKQKEIQRPHQRMLFSLQMQDLVVLAEMEWNGLYYNLEKSKQKAKEIETEISQIQAKLALHHSVPSFNWSSNDHLSALLYGGEIEDIIKVPNGSYKTGEKAGQTKYKNEVKTYHLPRKYKPVKGSKLKKEGKWSVAEEYLRQIKEDEDLIKGILRIKELEKLNSTYFVKLPKLHTEEHWEPNIIHGNFNQVVAATGRLSCSKPNLQNNAEAVQELFESRYD
jgi:DNA polymerase I